MATELAHQRLKRLQVSDRRFGVELEIICPEGRAQVAQALRNAGIQAEREGYNHYTVDYWKIVTDASIVVYDGYGMEVVSPPLKGKAGMQTLKRVMEVLKGLGATVNNTCGLHVHHDVTDEPMETVRNLVKFYTIHERVVDGFIAARRRNGRNEYCRHIADGIAHGDRRALWQILDGSACFDDLEYEWVNRQTTVNCQCLRRRTVEFRHHDASMDFADVAYWIAFTQSIVDAASEGVLTTSMYARPNKDRLYRIAKVQPIVRWHFNEREEELKDDEVEPFADGYYADEEDDDDPYDDGYDDDCDDDAWGTDEDDGGWGAPIMSTDGTLYFEDCHCAHCEQVRNGNLGR